MAYFPAMTQKILFNASCPICSWEISGYARYAQTHEMPLVFEDIAMADLAAVGLTPEMAARRLHMIVDGELISGMDAQRALWRAIPHMRWVAVLTGLPGIKQLANLTYDHIAAPLLYGLHKRRQRRACAN